LLGYRLRIILERGKASSPKGGGPKENRIYPLPRTQLGGNEMGGRSSKGKKRGRGRSEAIESLKDKPGLSLEKWGDAGFKKGME